MQRNFSVVYSLADGRFASRYPALQHLPFILDARPGFHRLANSYLVERGLALWSPAALSAGRPNRIPTKQTMLSYAQWLANFLEWADVRRVDIQTCSYVVHVAGRYQSEMLKGLWSRDGLGRAPATANLRVQQACDFLSWMADRGHRQQFDVPYETLQVKIGSATSSMGQVSREVRSRTGKVRNKKRVLHMPTDDLVRKWLVAVQESAGATCALMCETILLTAMRREEVTSLRTDTLPENPREWQIANPLAPHDQQQVRLSIRFGTKGAGYGEDHGDKIGPERSILIPLRLAQRWHEYRRHSRNLAFKRRLDGVRGVQARLKRSQSAVHLFLRQRDGERFAGKELYDAWVSADLPIGGWSPHQGRHWWACSVLWRELKKHERIASLTGDIAAALLESTAISIIRLHIQPQLGHAQDSTTMIYLQWVVDMLGTPVSLDDDVHPPS